MNPIALEWLKRLLGYGSAAAAPWVAIKTGNDELGGLVGTAIAVIGGLVLNKALPMVLPTARKVAEHIASKPLPK